MSTWWESLGRIRWRDLTHAHGPAGDVPRLLWTMTSDDLVQRDENLHHLVGALVHQGDLGTASVAAVPFLVRLATSPGAGGSEAAEVLTAMSLATHYRQNASLADAWRQAMVTDLGQLIVAAGSGPAHTPRFVMLAGLLASLPEGRGQLPALAARVASREAARQLHAAAIDGVWDQARFVAALSIRIERGFWSLGIDHEPAREPPGRAAFDELVTPLGGTTFRDEADALLMAQSLAEAGDEAFDPTMRALAHVRHPSLGAHRAFTALFAAFQAGRTDAAWENQARALLEAWLAGPTSPDCPYLNLETPFVEALAERAAPTLLSRIQATPETPRRSLSPWGTWLVSPRSP